MMLNHPGFHVCLIKLLACPVWLWNQTYSRTTILGYMTSKITLQTIVVHEEGLTAMLLWIDGYENMGNRRRLKVLSLIICIDNSDLPHVFGQLNLLKPIFPKCTKLFPCSDQNGS